MISIATTLTSAHTNVHTITRKCRSQIYPAKAGPAGRIPKLARFADRNRHTFFLPPRACPVLRRQFRRVRAPFIAGHRRNISCGRAGGRGGPSNWRPLSDDHQKSKAAGRASRRFCEQMGPVACVHLQHRSARPSEAHGMLFCMWFRLLGLCPLPHSSAKPVTSRPLDVSRGEIDGAGRWFRGKRVGCGSAGLA